MADIFILNAAITRALQYSLSSAESTQFLVLMPLSLRSIPILCSHLCLEVPNGGLFVVGLPDKMLKALLASSILAKWPVHLNLLDLITLNIVGEWYKQ